MNKTCLHIICSLVMMLLTTSFQANTADIAIINAQVIDGSGSPAFPANVVISDGKIKHIDRNLGPVDARRVSQANGRVLTPGFIDLHAHGAPLVHGEFKNFLAMGVTTITLGQDGSSPLTEDLSEWKQADGENEY